MLFVLVEGRSGSIRHLVCVLSVLCWDRKQAGSMSREVARELAAAQSTAFSYWFHSGESCLVSCTVCICFHVVLSLCVPSCTLLRLLLSLVCNRTAPSAAKRPLPKLCGTVDTSHTNTHTVCPVVPSSSVHREWSDVYAPSRMTEWGWGAQRRAGSEAKPSLSRARQQPHVHTKKLLLTRSPLILINYQHATYHFIL